MLINRKLPWRLQKDFPWAFCDADGVPIGECYGAANEGEVAKQNALTIIDAVNGIAAELEDCWNWGRIIAKLEAALRDVRDALATLDRGSEPQPVQYVCACELHNCQRERLKSHEYCAVDRRAFEAKSRGQLTGSTAFAVENTSLKARIRELESREAEAWALLTDVRFSGRNGLHDDIDKWLAAMDMGTEP